MNVIQIINRIACIQPFRIINQETAEIIFYGYVPQFDDFQCCIDYDFRKLLVNRLCVDNGILDIYVSEVWLNV